MDVLARFLHFLATQCVTGLQAAVRIEVDDRSYAEHYLPSQRLVNHKRNSQAEHFQTGELDFRSFGIGTERQIISFLNETGTARHPIVAPRHTETHRNRSGIRHYIIIEFQQIVPHQFIRCTHIYVHSFGGIQCIDHPESESTYTQFHPMLARLGILAYEGDGEVPICILFFGDDGSRRIHFHPLRVEVSGISFTPFHLDHHTVVSFFDGNFIRILYYDNGIFRSVCITGQAPYQQA